MSKDKQIEEMANIIFESSPIPSVWRSDATRFAEILTNAGYLKASEIFEELEYLSMDGRIPMNGYYAELKKKYTEECKP